MELTRNKRIIFKLLLLISWPALGLLMPLENRPKFLLINSLIIFVTVLVLVIRRARKITVTRKNFWISFILASYTDRLFLSLFTDRIALIKKLLIDYTHIESIRFIIYPAIALIIFPAILFCVYWFVDTIVPKIIDEFKTITKFEKRYLIVTLIIGGLLVISTSLLTNAFHVPATHKYDVNDIIYTSDSGAISRTDAWTNLEHSENDIRQPLFAVFSFPISIPCHLISEFLFFIPREYAFFVTMGFFQFMILAIVNIMLARLINLKEKDKIFYFGFTSLTFPFILFGLILEQYVIGLFYLIATIYYYFNHSENINYLYLGATGTTITSGILFPLITKFKGVKDWISKVFKCFISFIMLLILSGQFAQVFMLHEKIPKMMKFTGVEISFMEKFNQFTYFIKSIFIPPEGIVRKNVYDVISYQLAPVNTICIFGIVILIITLISLIVNWKNKMSRVCFFWVFFSFVILVLVGWGTAENGQILYSLYFAWGYYALIYMLINKIKSKGISRTIIVVFTIILLFTAVLELSNIMKFALKYYLR